MFDNHEDILDYFRGTWIKRKFFYICAWILCPLGWLIISLLPNQYESSARVYVDTDSILGPLLEGLTVEVDPSVKIDLMVKTLLSRENLDRIIRMTDLDLEANTPAKYEALVEGLGTDFNIKKARKANIFTLSIRNKDPETAKNIVQSALTVFIENTIGDNRTDSNTAQRFINDQIKDFEDQLITSEQKLAAFKQKHSDVLPSFSRGYYATLQREKDELRKHELQYRVLEKRIEKANGDLTGFAPKMIFKSSYDDRLENLQLQLDNLLLGYKPAHPDVIEIKRRISEVKKLKLKEIEDKRNAFKNNPQLADTGVNENNKSKSIVQEMQSNVNNLNSELTAQSVQVSEYSRRVKELEGKIHTIPLIEAELKALTRGYENTKSKYEDFLSRRSAAHLANEVEENTDKIEFNIIDPPRVPTKPVGPKHVLLTLGVLVVGLGAGGALAFLLSQLSPVATSHASVIKASGFPILGAVEASATLGLAKKKSAAIRNFILSNLVLLGIMCALIVYFAFPSLINAAINLIKGMM